MKRPDPIELELFKNVFIAVSEEMGAVLGRTALSPNIKERKDFSCSLFNEKGETLAQGSHIPVHLGAMPLSVQAALGAVTFEKGDLVLLNDPYRAARTCPTSPASPRSSSAASSAFSWPTGPIIRTSAA